VATAVYHALFSDQPKLRYMVGTHWEGNRVINTLIDRLLDANDSPEHSYSRDAADRPAGPTAASQKRGGAPPSMMAK
jgi:hypothetical protein